MSDLAIQAEHLGKRFRLGQTAPYGRLSETLARAPGAMVRSAGRLLGGPARRRPDAATRDADPASTMWALRDINLELREGEVLGIIGRNGAGKSTLLKILSRITQPTEGHATLHGRVSSLLEVGTGFHPELTGRENIYLNGAILGMRRPEIRAKFDAIVDFSGVSAFIDTPVKRYSSGMRVRLAFAVAAHLEPEILIIDEVLAVGDAEFQRRCLGRMSELGRGGRTILFVSHNISAVRGLCNRAIMLNAGRLAAEGSPGEVIRTYINGVGDEAQYATEYVRVLNWTISNGEGDASRAVRLGDDVVIDVELDVLQPLRRPTIYFMVMSQFGRLFNASTELDGQSPDLLPVGRHRVGVRFHQPQVMPQMYTVRFGITGQDTKTQIMPPTDLTEMSVEATASDFGFSGTRAEATLGKTSPMYTPWTWRFPCSDSSHDARPSTVDSPAAA